jgi:anti-sigma-K factor RsiG
MKDECTSFETSLSYYRRLAQARIEILDAEVARRARGGSVEELIAELPDILAGEGSRAPASQVRIAEPDVPLVPIEWDDNRQLLVSDSTLADLPVLDDTRLGEVREQVQSFERELSDLRHRLHGVLDGVEHEIATRQAAGASG